jgi:hypothetical protein
VTTKAQKAVIREAMAIYEASSQFPVKSFILEKGKVTYRWFRGDYSLMNELVAACEKLAAKEKP